MPYKSAWSLRFLTVAFALSAQACIVVRPARTAPATPGATTVIVVRHAEKSTDDPRDPSLTADGRARAIALRDLLKDAGIADIYITQYKRNRQTAEPLAQQSGIPIIERPINPGNSATYADDLAREILSSSAGRGVLVVGHSNTVPDIVRALSGKEVVAITDMEYDRIFMIVISASGPVRLVETRFGAHGLSGSLSLHTETIGLSSAAQNFAR